MSPDKQRIAIAEACPDAIRFISELGASGKWCYRHLDAWFDCRHNDPLADLNAMHEAEKVIKASGVEAWAVYWEHLSHVAGCDIPIDATAAQRAEAFLRTIRKREDSPENAEPPRKP